MRVLLIDVNCKHSSTGKIVYDLHTLLTAQGHTSAVTYGRGPKIKEPGIFKFGLDLETVFHAVMTRLTGLTGMFSFFSTRRLIRFIKKFNPDVVHIHELHAYFVNIGPLMKYLKKHTIKTVWTFHCEFMYTGKCGHALDCDKFETECHHCPQLREYPKSLIFDFTRFMHKQKKNWFEGFDHLTIVTPSPWLADRVKRSFLSSKNIQVIHNGIDTHIFEPKTVDHLIKRHQLEGKKVVLAVAPDLMSQAKGGRYVVKVAHRLKDENIRFILIGVEDLKSSYGDTVIALGKTTNQEELAQYYTLADLSILTSQAETFSLVTVESLACGTPVVGFDSGAPKTIAPSPYGQFVPYGNLEALTKAVKDNLNHKEAITPKATQQFAKTHYHKSVMFNQYLALYGEGLS